MWVGHVWAWHVDAGCRCLCRAASSRWAVGNQRVKGELSVFLLLIGQWSVVILLRSVSVSDQFAAAALVLLSVPTQACSVLGDVMPRVKLYWNMGCCRVRVPSYRDGCGAIYPSQPARAPALPGRSWTRGAPKSKRTALVAARVRGRATKNPRGRVRVHAVWPPAPAVRSAAQHSKAAEMPSAPFPPRCDCDLSEDARDWPRRVWV